MGKNGLSYFWCGAIAIFLSWTMSGCYFGNKEVDAPFNGPWYYETQLNTIKLCAATNGQAAQCANQVSTSYLPQFYIPLASGLALDFSSLSDPIVFNQVDSASASLIGANYSISNPDSLYLSFVVNANGTSTSPISYDASSQVEVFHDINRNPTCVLDTTVHITGSLTNSGPYNSFTNFPLSGRMIFTAIVTMTADPASTSCDQAVRCYNDPQNQCQGVDFNEVQSIFQDFINSTTTASVPVLSLDPVNGVYPTVNSLSYTIQYQ